MIFIGLFLNAQAQKKQVLLIGTFHFNNPGLDASKLVSLDIQSAASQKDIAKIVEAIREFQPDKILVERDFTKQGELDQLFTDFLNHKEATEIAENSEIYQIAFKAAQILGLKNVIGIDYKVDLPGDSLMEVLAADKQVQLGKEIDAYVKSLSGSFNESIKKGSSLLDLIIAQNTSASRDRDISFYTTLLTRVGDQHNFIGADVASIWYQRNINIFSLIQKSVEVKDKKIVVLLGASHIAVLQKFFLLHPGYSIVELSDLVGK